MISCSAVEITSVTLKPGKEKGIECNEKLLMKTCVCSACLYEPERQRLSTRNAGEPIFAMASKRKHKLAKYQPIGTLSQFFARLSGENVFEYWSIVFRKCIGHRQVPPYNS